ncbi:MAG: hypothetical protein IPP62_10220 [bacterium]|nr:hypothetical protein [bacterium]
MAFADSLTAVSVGFSNWVGYTMRTTDGGLTWASIPPAADRYLHDISFVDARHGFAVGTGGTVVRTADGGQTWSRVSGTYSSTLNAVAAAGPWSCIVASSGGAILQWAPEGR